MGVKCHKFACAQDPKVLGLHNGATIYGGGRDGKGDYGRLN
jgi:hypothetical protein